MQNSSCSCQRSFNNATNAICILYLGFNFDRTGSIIQFIQGLVKLLHNHLLNQIFKKRKVQYCKKILQYSQVQQRLPEQGENHGLLKEIMEQSAQSNDHQNPLTQNLPGPLTSQEGHRSKKLVAELRILRTMYT